jgi:hypothetical protein
MRLDKTALKRQIDQSKPNQLLVFTVNKLEKNSLQICQKEIEKFIKKQEDYVITIIKR